MKKLSQCLLEKFPIIKKTLIEYVKKINGKPKIIFIVELNNPKRKSWLGTQLANYGTEWHAGRR